VPLWWDQGTLDDLKAWKGERQAHGAKSEDQFVCCLWPGRLGIRTWIGLKKQRFRGEIDGHPPLRRIETMRPLEYDEAETWRGEPISKSTSR